MAREKRLKLRLRLENQTDWLERSRKGSSGYRYCSESLTYKLLPLPNITDEAVGKKNPPFRSHFLRQLR